MTQTQPQLPLHAYEPTGIKGSTTPRLSTPPLRELTPDTTYGYNVIEFARDVLQEPLTPWQEWFVIHAGELLEDGRPRFRKVLCLVARQNGKTHLLKVLAAYWLLIDRVEQILGLSTNRESAKEAWDKARKLIEANPLLAGFMKTVKVGNNDTYMETAEGAVYRIRAANDGAARGLTVDRIIFDELRQQKTFDAWDAVLPTMAARPHAQAIAISNAGDDRSVVLNQFRKEALELIHDDYYAAGVDKSRIGLFEWSADPLDEIDRPETWAKANPNMGYIFTEEELYGDALSAKKLGGAVLTGFKTERLCQHVPAMDAAIQPEKWAACYNPELSLENVAPSQRMYCLDMSWDKTHATLAVAGVPVGKEDPHVGLVSEWRDAATRNVMRDIRALIKEHKIKNLGIMPVGPALAFADELQAMRIPGLTVDRISEQTAAVMTLADLVDSGRLTHHSIDTEKQKVDEVLTRQIIAAERKEQGDAWRFTRRNMAPCDAAFAAAGAVHMVKAKPEPAKPMIMSFKPNKERS